jgi:hypothetical protein
LWNLPLNFLGSTLEGKIPRWRKNKSFWVVLSGSGRRVNILEEGNKSEKGVKGTQARARLRVEGIRKTERKFGKERKIKKKYKYSIIWRMGIGGERGRGTQKGENRIRVENESGRGEK